jgi:hypothetical protein
VVAEFVTHAAARPGALVVAVLAELAAELVAAPLDLDVLAALVAIALMARRGDDAGRAAWSRSSLVADRGARAAPLDSWRSGARRTRRGAGRRAARPRGALVLAELAAELVAALLDRDLDALAGRSVAEHAPLADLVVAEHAPLDLRACRAGRHRAGGRTARPRCAAELVAIALVAAVVAEHVTRAPARPGALVVAMQCSRR